MTLFLRTTVYAAIGFGLMSMVTVSANAAPVALSVLTPSEAASRQIETVQYRRFSGGSRYRGSSRFRGNSGRNIGLGIGAAIIGGIILSEAARAEHRQSHGSDWQRCADTFRSFERDTGMYTGYDGIRRTCPYLN
jgi:hypothetical protein